MSRNFCYHEKCNITFLADGNVYFHPHTGRQGRGFWWFGWEVVSGTEVSILS